jgi:23S rRNA pseudouridine1911/1915/1917 synthase
LVKKGLNLSYKIKKFNLQRKIKVFKFLLENFSITMKDAQRWVDKGRVMQNGVAIVQKNFELFGDIEVVVFEPTSLGLKPIFETSDFAIFDKPSGVLVHPSNRHTTYSITHEAKYLFGSQANIVHRLDKETSGLIAVSKSKRSEKILKQLFEKREITKGYLALVRGKIDNEIFIDAPIKKNRAFEDIKLKVYITEQGKAAQTLIKPIKYFKKRDQTLVEAIPKTGRQHQIRVHLFHIDHPIVGDPIYGVGFENADRYLNGNMSEEDRVSVTGATRLMLHANWLEFKYKSRYKIYSKSIFIKKDGFDDTTKSH